MIGSNSQITCPRCKQRISAELEQILDVAVDNQIKQRLLSGNINIIDCPLCSFHGMATIPIVYHDPEKELLLTYTPPGLNLPLPEKEQMLGALTRAIVNRIPSDQRKAYLLQPKEMFSIEGLTTTILNSDGITNEMIDEQRSKMELLQTLISTPEEMLPNLIKERDEELDDHFFHLLSTLRQSYNSQQPDPQAPNLDKLEETLFSHSSFGKRSQEYASALQTSASKLEDLGTKLTRETFLTLILEAPDDIHITSLITLARPAADYEFFILLTNKLENSTQEDQAKLEHIRSLVLETVQKIDQVSQERAKAAQSILESLIQANNPKELIEDFIKDIDQSVLALLQQLINNAHTDKNTEEEKNLIQLQTSIMEALHQHAPPSIRFINDLLSLRTREEAEIMIKSQVNELDDDIQTTMQNVVDQLESDTQTELAAKLRDYIQLVQKEIKAYRKTS